MLLPVLLRHPDLSETVTVSGILQQFTTLVLIRFSGHVPSNIKFWNLTISKTKCSKSMIVRGNFALRSATIQRVAHCNWDGTFTILLKSTNYGN